MRGVNFTDQRLETDTAAKLTGMTIYGSKQHLVFHDWEKTYVMYLNCRLEVSKGKCNVVPMSGHHGVGCTLWTLHMQGRSLQVAISEHTQK
jgi:hypothetical protein